MKLTNDRERNMAYLQIGAAGSQVEIRQLADDLLMDFGPDGEVCGLEFLDANRQLAALSAGQASASRPTRYEVYRDLNGEFRFRLKASNGQILFGSEGFKTKLDALKAIESLRDIAISAPVEEVG